MDYTPFRTSARRGGSTTAPRFGWPRSTRQRRVRVTNVRARIETRDNGTLHLVSARRIPNLPQSRPRGTKRYALIEYDQRTGQVFEVKEAKHE